MLGNKQLVHDGNKLGNKQVNAHSFGNKYLTTYNRNQIAPSQIEQHKPFQSPLEKTSYATHPMYKNMHS